MSYRTQSITVRIFIASLKIEFDSCYENLHLFWASVNLGNSLYDVCVGGWSRGGKYGRQNAIVLGPILCEEGEWSLPFLSCIHEKALCR